MSERDEVVERATEYLKTKPMTVGDIFLYRGWFAEFHIAESAALMEENVRLREALERIAQPSHLSIERQIIRDHEQTARAALEGK